jgi:hypothetical protein
MIKPGRFSGLFFTQGGKTGRKYGKIKKTSFSGRLPDLMKKRENDETGLEETAGPARDRDR